MKIQKKFQGVVPENKILDTYSESETDTYSCNYINSVVESGNNDNGNWIKYSDGTMICTRDVTGTANITSAWGSMYESPRFSLGDMPQTFIEPPKVFATPYVIACFVEAIYDTTTTSFGDTYLALPLSYANRSYYLHLMAIGRWK